ALGNHELAAGRRKRGLPRDVDRERARSELADHFVRREGIIVDRERSVRSSHGRKITATSPGRIDDRVATRHAYICAAAPPSAFRDVRSHRPARIGARVAAPLRRWSTFEAEGAGQEVGEPAGLLRGDLAATVFGYHDDLELARLAGELDQHLAADTARRTGPRPGGHHGASDRLPAAGRRPRRPPPGRRAAGRRAEGGF